MLFIGLIILLIAVPLFSYTITPSLFNRITSVTLLFAGCLSINALYVENISNGLSIYNGLFHVTTISLGIEAFLFFIGAFILYGWASSVPAILGNTTATPTIREHSLIILFTTLGASLLVSSSDIVSMFLAIELQSFAVYVLATLYRDSESSTAAGLKYFLLGGLSSALILLGTGIIYSTTGLTHFESIYSLLSVPSREQDLLPFVFGLLLIGIGFLFKVAAAPFHNWAPDVYDGTPTIITVWLSTIPKISIFILLLELQSGFQGNNNSLVIILGDNTEGIDIWKNLLLSASLLSLILGTVLGLSQYRIKRLLTYSTISHVGFLLLALAINTEESVESFLFYILQYSFTNLTIFLVLLAFGYTMNNSPNERGNHYDIVFIQELKGQFSRNPLLSLSFSICLFSIAGIPPLIGFFAKQTVLYSSMHSGYYFLSFVAILVSVISASYYLRIVQVLYFYNPDYSDETQIAGIQSVKEYPVTTIHSTIIATFTAVITLFMFHPTILLNSCQLLALSLYY